MTDDVDLDIERMLRVHRNRKALGYSWYDANGHAGARFQSDAERKQLQNARQVRRRDHKREAS